MLRTHVVSDLLFSVAGLLLIQKWIQVVVSVYVR